MLGSRERGSIHVGLCVCVRMYTVHAPLHGYIPAPSGNGLHVMGVQ